MMGRTLTYTKIFLVLIVLWSFSVMGVHAKPLSGYYANVITEWGLKTVTLGECADNLGICLDRSEKVVNLHSGLLEQKSSVELLEAPMEEGSLYFYKEHFSEFGNRQAVSPIPLLLITGEVGKEEDLIRVSDEYQTIIIICVNTVNFWDVQCSPSGTSSLNDYKVGSYGKDKLELKISIHNLGKKNYLFIPSKLLDVPVYSLLTKDFVIEYAKSTVPLGSIKNSKTPTILPKDQHVTSILIYMLVLLGFTSVFYKSFLYVYRRVFQISIIHKNFYWSHYRTPIWFKNISLFSLVISFGLLAMLFTTLYFVSYGDLGELSLSYLMSYLKFTIMPSNLRIFLENDNYLRIIIFLLSISITLTSLVSISPVFIFLLDMVFRSVAGSITSIRISKGFKAIFTLSTTCLVLSTSLLKSDYGVVLYITLLFVVIYLLYYAFVKNIKMSTLYSSIEKNYFSVALIFLSFASLLSLYLQHIKPSTYVYEDLIGRKAATVFLPYKKDYEDGVLFKDYALTNKNPIFINNYLVFHPKFTKIINKNLEDIEVQENIMLVNFLNEDEDDLYLRMVSDANLAKFFVNNTEVSNVIYTSDLQLFEPVIDISILCKANAQEVPSSNISLDIYYYSKESSADKKHLNLLDFPGCPDNSSVQRYSLELGDTLVGENIILKINGLSVSYIESLVLRDASFGLLPTSNILLEGSTVIENLTNPNSSTLYVYSLSDLSEAVFDRDFEDTNISPFINHLKMMGALGNPFIIWSNAPNETIRSLPKDTPEPLNH